MIVKFIAAAIVPGGFIIWGLHELSKRSKRVTDNSSSSGDDPKEPKSS